MIHDRSKSGDAEVIAGLRTIYLAPSDESYWSSLEARILAHVTRGGEVQVWWAELPRMTRPALAAAAALVIAASAALVYTRQLEVRSAYAAGISAAPVEEAARASVLEVADVDVAITLVNSQ